MANGRRPVDMEAMTHQWQWHGLFGRFRYYPTTSSMDKKRALALSLGVDVLKQHYSQDPLLHASALTSPDDYPFEASTLGVKTVNYWGVELKCPYTGVYIKANPQVIGEYKVMRSFTSIRSIANCFACVPHIYSKGLISHLGKRRVVLGALRSYIDFRL